jgi:hypothetical protein
VAFLGAFEETPGDRSEARRCAVDVGRCAEPAISVNVCTPSSANTIKIAVTLLVTDRPASIEFPAMRHSSSL